MRHLRSAVVEGGKDRPRPMLLTAEITILGLAMTRRADGPDAEVIRPMVTPALGGMLAADEVIDMHLAVLFFPGQATVKDYASRHP